jgi:outer membrane protein TolC
VAARTKELEAVKVQFAAETVSRLDVAAAEAQLYAAQAALADAQGEHAEAVRCLTQLVAALREKRKYTAERANAGMLPPTAVHAIDAEIALAEVRLAEAMRKAPPAAP